MEFGTKPPEPKGPEQKKWKDGLTADVNVALFNVAANIEKYAKVPLPDGKKADEFLGWDVYEILDYAEKIASDGELWSKIPETFSTWGSKMTKDELKKELENLIQECKG